MFIFGFERIHSVSFDPQLLTIPPGEQRKPSTRADGRTIAWNSRGQAAQFRLNEEMMKHISIVVLILALVGCGRETPMIEGNSRPQESPGVGLRRMVLSTPVSKLGFSSDSDFPTVYGVLTDWDLGDVTATVMSMRDGTASLYTTSTFGIIGGQGHKRVLKAAVRYVKLAERYVDSSKPVTDFPHPKSGQVYFYILTYNGVRLCIGDKPAIESGSDPTRPLFAAAQDVLTELRLITEKERAQPEG